MGRKPVTKEIVKEDQELRLQPRELYELMYLETKIQNQQLTKRLMQLEWERTVAAQSQKVRQIDKEEEDAKKRYLELVKDVETRLNIKMSEYTYDDQTGNLVNASTK